MQVNFIFDDFDLERGFDRLLLRHFNQSFSDPPLTFTGDKVPAIQTFWVEYDTSKTVCLQFQSDESIGASGFSVRVQTRYDGCKYESKYRADPKDENVVSDLVQPFTLNKLHPLVNEEYKMEWDSSPLLG